MKLSTTDFKSYIYNQMSDDPKDGVYGIQILKPRQPKADFVRLAQLKSPYLIEMKCGSIPWEVLYDRSIADIVLDEMLLLAEQLEISYYDGAKELVELEQRASVASAASQSAALLIFNR